MIAFCDHWQELLHSYFLRRQNEAFAWGKMDCCLFACDAILELTGVDLAQDFRGQYDSALSAMRSMRTFTTEDTEGTEALHAAAAEADAETEYELVEAVADKIAATHGIEEVPLLYAQRGDVILLDSPMGKGLGLLGLNGYTVHCTGPDGVVDVPLRECLRAWRIPKSCLDHPLNRK